MTTEIATTSPPEAVRPESGELVAASERIPLSERYRGASLFPVTETQAEILTAPVDPNDLDILPTGEVYLTQVKYRQRLTAAFKPGGWAMVPADKPAMIGATLMQPWALYCGGAFIASAYGEAEYHRNNPRSSYATAAETLKSNALMRCCKDLGIASECWDHKFTEAFKAERCEKVGDKWRLKARGQKPAEVKP
jgi:hypothetical protein